MRTLFVLGLLTVYFSTLVHGYDEFCRKGRKKYDNGQEVPTGDPCEFCTCVADGNSEPDIMCAMMACYCPGRVEDDGTCCGRCIMDECLVDGKSYKDGQDIPTDDPCETCMCMANGIDEPNVECYMMACECPGRVEDDGTCCGRCLPPGCVVDGKTYNDGDKIKPFNECAPCYCHADGSAEGQVICAMMDCAPCDGGSVVDDGSCCGKCVEQTYTLGAPIFSLCLEAQCPRLKCKEKDQYKDPEKCCPECKCKVKRKYYNPGETVGDKCDGCVCRNGKVECNPPECPKVSCVDPVRGDDCCYTCPNGVTCLAGKTVVRKDEGFKKVKSNVCSCMGDPWYPNAFCASRKISKSLKGMTDELKEFEQF